MIELTFTQTNIRQTFSGDYEVGLIITASQKQAVEQLYNDTNECYKPMVAKIGLKRNKRSLDANAYAWSLLTELANVMRIGKDECYIMMLKRYGQSQMVKVLTQGLPILLKAIKYYDLGKEIDNCTYVKIHTGSSEFDTKEMAIFIDGIVSECKEQGIQTMTPSEIEKLKELWK